MEKPNRFNAAQRLLEIVNELRTASQKEPTWRVYLLCYEAGKDKADALMFAYELAKLANDIERTVKASETVPDEFLGNLKPIFDQCREINLERPWREYISRLKPEAIVALQAHAHLFTAVCNEVRLTKEQYDELVMSVSELFEVVDSCKHEELREVLLAILESARRAINLYKISGAKPFAESFDCALGKLMVVYHRESFSNLT